MIGGRTTLEIRLAHRGDGTLPDRSVFFLITAAGTFSYRSNLESVCFLNGPTH